MGLSSTPSTAFAQTAQEIAKRAFGSTVLLVMEDANGQPLSLGSGFCVGDARLATNIHVIGGAARGYVKLVSVVRVCCTAPKEGVLVVAPDKMPSTAAGSMPSSQPRAGAGSAPRATTVAASAR
jgi:S1-C subfamily serine protease